MNGFHSTKEGFKAPPAPSLWSASSRFPFHQGRFQGHTTTFYCHFCASFHSTKEGFKGVAVKWAQQVRPSGFHSTKEGFKGSPKSTWCKPSIWVSIPPRKVSRRKPASPASRPRSVSIPPRKVSRSACRCGKRNAQVGFPFHQGRFQGTRSIRSRFSVSSSFHSTKEGFKVRSWKRHC